MIVFPSGIIRLTSSRKIQLISGAIGKGMIRVHPGSSFVLLLCLGLALPLVANAGVQSDAPETIRLIPDVRDLPYQFELVRVEDFNFIYGSWWNRFSYFMDLDGDGHDDVVRARNRGITAAILDGDNSFVIWQANLPPAHSWGPHCALIEGGFDIDGDGVSEVIACSAPQDRSDWRIWAISRSESIFVAETPLPTTPENRMDGVWDGDCKVIGVIQAAGPDGRERPAYIVCWIAGFDLQPRGLMAVAIDDGEVIWSSLNGACPNEKTVQIVDLEGDGVAEIVYSTRAVNNLGGRLINGFSDDHGLVFVFGQDGGLRWSRRLFKGSGIVNCGLMDCDCDGVIDVIAGTSQAVSAGNYVVALSGVDGSEIAVRPVRGQVVDLCVLNETAGSPGPADFVVSNGMIMSFSCVADSIVPVAAVDSGKAMRIMDAADFLPEPGTEILAVDSAGSVFCLTGDLRPMARRDDSERIWFINGTKSYRSDTGGLRTELISTAGMALTLDLVESPAGPVSWWLFALAPAVGAVTIGFRRRRRQQPFSLAGIRETRLHLLDKLELASHGAIGALRSLRRLVWLLEAMRHGGDVSQIRPRVVALAEEIIEMSLPDISGILETADDPVSSHDLVIRAKEGLALVELQLKDLCRLGFPAGTLDRAAADLRAASDDTERALQKIRADVANFFVCSPSRILDRVLDNRDLEMQGAGIEVAMPHGWLDVPLCRIDQSEMSFIIDNLVSNAVNAMSGSVRQDLRFEWSAECGMVELSVSDSGCGIVPDDWERIMNTRFSTAGGGMGLPRSRRILRKYDGRIYVQSSAPGRGTTFKIEVPAAVRDQ